MISNNYIFNLIYFYLLEEVNLSIRFVYFFSFLCNFFIIIFLIYFIIKLNYISSFFFF